MAEIKNPDRIKLECSVDDRDKLNVFHVFTSRSRSLVFDLRDVTSTAQVYLDEESVRELFCWLGVWLHDLHR